MTIVGKGNEIVILTHGFGTDQSVWKHLVPHLVDDYRVVLYDNIGAGTTNPDYFDNIGAGTYSPSCKSFRCNLASSLVTLSPLWWASSLPSLTLISSPNSSSSLLLKGKINLWCVHDFFFTKFIRFLKINFQFRNLFLFYWKFTT